MFIIGRMSAEPVDPRRVEAAAQRIVAGQDIRTAFLALLADGTTPDGAAAAVCVAFGSPADEAVARLRTFAGLWDALGPGEEAEGVDLLIERGYFEPDVTGDERQQAARASLQAAVRAVPALPSGLAVSLSTQLRTGRHAEAFLCLERLGRRRWPDNASFWAAMREASDRGIGTGGSGGAQRRP